MASTGGLASVLSDLTRGSKRRSGKKPAAKGSRLKAMQLGISGLPGGGVPATSAAVPSHLAAFAESRQPLLRFESGEAAQAALQRHINSVTAENVRTRRTALQQLHAHLFAAVPTAGAGFPEDPYPAAAAAEDAAFLAPSTALAAPPSAAAAGAAAAPPGVPAFQPGGDSDDEDGTDAAPVAGDGSSRGSLLRHLLQPLLKPLLTRVGDTSEPCRELALAMLARFVPVVADLRGFMAEVLPVALERLPQAWSYDMQHNAFVQNADSHAAFLRGRVVPGADPSSATVVEPSEECRALLCGLLTALVARCAAVGAPHLLDGAAHDLVLATAVQVWDPFPDLKVRACALLQRLCAVLPHVLKVFAIGFAKHLGPALTHRYARVRLAALDALQDVVAVPKPEKRKGAGTEAIADLVGFREDNVIPIKAFYGEEVRHNYFASLATDGNIAVRARFIRLLGEWLWSLPDRWDHEARLLPYLLAALGDATVEVSSAAFAWLENLGARYEREKAQELLDEKQHAIDGDVRVDYDKPLPLPFAAGRPRRGLRLIVRNNCRRFFKPILAELGDWKGATRRSAAGLLVTVLIFLEEMVTQDVSALLRVLTKTVDDGEFGDLARTAARLTGRFVPPAAYLPLLLPLLTDAATAPQVRRGRAPDSEVLGALLRVLALLVSESRPSQVLPHTGAILAALASPRVLGAVSRDATPASLPVSAAPPGSAAAAADPILAAGVATHQLSLQQAAAAASNMQFAFQGSVEGYWVPFLAAAPGSRRPPSFAHAAAGGDATGFHRAQEGMALPLSLPDTPYDAGAASTAVRCHFTAVLAALSAVLHGRMGAYAGAAFDASGRLGDGAAATLQLLNLWALALGADELASAAVPPPRRVLSLVGEGALAAFAASNAGAGTRVVTRGDAPSAPKEVTAASGAGDTATADAPLTALLALHGNSLLAGCIADYAVDSLWTPASPHHVVLRFLLRRLPAALIPPHATALLQLAAALAVHGRGSGGARALEEALLIGVAALEAASEVVGEDTVQAALSSFLLPVASWAGSSPTLASGWASAVVAAAQPAALPVLGSEIVEQLLVNMQAEAGADREARLLALLPALAAAAVAGGSGSCEAVVDACLHWVAADASSAVRAAAGEVLSTAGLLSTAAAAEAGVSALLAALYDEEQHSSTLCDVLCGAAFQVAAAQPAAAAEACGAFRAAHAAAVTDGRQTPGREDWVGALEGHVAMLAHLSSA